MSDVVAIEKCEYAPEAQNVWICELFSYPTTRVSQKETEQNLPALDPLRLVKRFIRERLDGWTRMVED